MKKREDILLEVIQIVSDVSCYPATLISLSCDLVADLGMDSLDYIRMMGEIDSAFDIDLLSSRNFKVNTIKELVDKVESEIQEVNENNKKRKVKTSTKSSITPPATIKN